MRQRGLRGTGVTLKSSGVLPDSGTYKFILLTAGEVESVADVNTTPIKKVPLLDVQFVDGSLNQSPVESIEGVGGAVAIPGVLGSITPGLELKQVGQTYATAQGIDIIDSGNYPVGQTSDEDGADVVTRISAAAFGLDSPAKVAEADRVTFTIRYRAFQNIRNRKNTKHTAYAWYEVRIVAPGGAWADGIPCFDKYGKHIVHSGNTTAPTSFQHTIGINAFRPFQNNSFEILIARLTRHVGYRVTKIGTSEGQTTDDYWTFLAEAEISSCGSYITDRFSYPYSSVASISFSSKKYNGVPKRSYLLEGLRVQVPDTYTPREKSSTGVAQYSGFWGGSFSPTLTYTDNPAWVFYDIVTNNRYGAGTWINADDIDKYALYRIAKYCDDLVPDGKGGTEPRFRANLYLTKATDVYKILKDIASMFTGMLYWMDGQLTVVQDTPSDPIYTFTKGNVIEGSFSYESTGSKTRVNQIVVTWNDPTINYEPSPLIVEDRESIVRTGKIISQSAVAFGATSEGQAIRYGRWKLWTALNQTEAISFKTGLQGSYIKPGDIINVQDADRYAVSYSGRISSYTPGTLVLDRAVAFTSGSTYTLSTLVTEPATFYTGYTAVTIGTDTYTKGDRITQAYVDTDGTGTGTSLSLVTLDTEAKASNAFVDSAGTNPLETSWQEYSYVQTQEITNPATTTNTLSLTTAVAVATETIWALSEVVGAGTVLGSTKEYRVLGVSKDKDTEVTINAVEYYPQKFDAIDTDYELGTIPTSIYLEREPETVPAPSNIYVVLETDASNPGEEIRVFWDAPENYEFVSRYQLEHDVPDLESVLSISENSIAFTNLASGTYTFRVRTVSPKGNVSAPTSISYILEDIFDENVPRMQEGIPKGIIANSTFLLTSGNTLAFTKNPASVVSVGASLSTARVIDGADAIDVSSLDYGTEYSVLFADSTLDLAYYDTTTLPEIPHWIRLAGTETAASSRVNKWTSVGSTASCAANSTIVKGVGTSWLTTLKTRDIVIFGASVSAALTGKKGALVTSILSDTEIRIDKTFSTAQTSVGLFRRTFRPDTNNDSIFATISKTQGTPDTYNLEKFITLDPSLETGKYVAVETSPTLLQYEFDSPNAQLSAPSNITCTTTAIGFVSPLFKVSTISSGLDGTVQTTFNSPNNGDFGYDFTLDAQGAVDYLSGVQESVTVQVVESTRQGDIFEGVGIISKVTAGSDGISGATVFLQAEDYSIVYDEAGLSPTYNNTVGTAGTLTFTASSQNLTAPRYKFTFLGGNLASAGDFTLGSFGSFATGTTATVSVPANHTSWNSAKKQGNFQVKVEVAEAADTATVLASDVVTVQGIHSLAGGYWVSLSNESSTISTTSNGIPLGTQATVGYAVGDSSGTSIEVGRGSTILTYVSGTPTLGEFSIGEVVSPTSAIDLGALTTSNTSLISYADHEFSTATSGWTQDTASVTYTINAEGAAGPTIVRRQTFTKSKKGFGGIAITNSNPVQSLPGDSAGNVLSYTGSGTSINVLLSGESLPYHSSHSTASSLNIETYWTHNAGLAVAVPSGKITVGTRGSLTEGSTSAVTWSDHSVMATDVNVVTVTYPIDVVVKGITESLTTSQVISRTTNASAVYITSSATHINFASDESTPSPTTYTLNWESILPAGVTAYYQLNGVNQGTSTSEPAITAVYATLPTTHTIELYNDSTYTTLLATDKITVNKSKDGSAGAAGAPGASVTGPSGDSGPRTSNFIIYYNTGSASSPGNPTATSYSFVNNTFAGLSAGWSTSAPQAVAGTTTSNYWYANVNVKEGITNGVGTGNTTSGTGGSMTIGSAFIGLGFTGLVTFNSLSASGTTTIDGARITTGTIDAQRISLSGKNITDLTNNAGYTDDTTATSAFNLAGGKNKTFYLPSTATPASPIAGDIWVQTDKADLSEKYKVFTTTWVSMNPSTVGGWTLTASSLYSGDVVNAQDAGFTSGAGHISINSGGSIHTPKFYVNQDGDAGFRGTVTIGGTDLTAANTLEQVQGAFTGNTTISGGTIVLSTETAGSITLDSTANQILIKEGATIRVKLGKLT